MSLDRDLQLELPASHESVRVARRLVGFLARTSGVPRAQVDELRLVVSELLGNAVDHGGGGGAMFDRDAVCVMGLRLAVSATSWTLEVSDCGRGKLEELQAHIGNELPDLEDERGRGFFLLEQMLDSLTVCASAHGGGFTFTAIRGFVSAETAS